MLENLNHEPDDAEVHYMGHSIEELHAVFDHIQSPHLRWGFSANHMHLLPGDFDSFIDEFGVGRIGLVLVADNRGKFEEHLQPGQGTMDFTRPVRSARRRWLSRTVHADVWQSRAKDRRARVPARKAKALVRGHHRAQ